MMNRMTWLSINSKHLTVVVYKVQKMHYKSLKIQVHCSTHFKNNSTSAHSNKVTFFYNTSKTWIMQKYFFYPKNQNVVILKYLETIAIITALKPIEFIRNYKN